MRGKPWNYNRVKKICLVCSSEFMVQPARDKTAKFCCLKCKYEWFRDKPISEELKKRLSEVHKRIGSKPPIHRGKRSKKWVENIKKGIKKHYDIVGRTTPKNKLLKKSKKWKEWREAVFRYDDYTCWICNEKGGELQPHHLYSFAYYPKLRFIISNGITLCKFCHKTYTDYGFNRK